MEHHCDSNTFNGKLGCSPSPTLIYPLPPLDLSQKDSVPDSSGDSTEGRDCQHSVTVDPNVNDLGCSQSSLGALDNKVHQNHSPSPEGRKMREIRRKSMKETSLSHQLSSSSLVSCSTPPRSTVVTDIDEAMAEMDRAYLKSLFGNTTSTNESQSPTNNIIYSPVRNVDDTEETNIDDEPTSAQMVNSLRQKSFETDHKEDSPGTPKCSTSEHRERHSKRQRYISSVSFDAAVKWPPFIPEQLTLRDFQTFDGETLSSWLSSTFDETHYLHHILTHHDCQIIIAQFCTHLLSAGVLSELGSKSSGNVFKSTNQYSWGQKDLVQLPASDDNLISQNAFPTLICGKEEMTKADQIQTPYQSTADHQKSISKITKEHRELEEKLKRDHEEEIHRIKESLAGQINRLNEQILHLENELKQSRTITKETIISGDDSHVLNKSKFKTSTELSHHHHTDNQKLASNSEATLFSDNDQTDVDRIDPQASVSALSSGFIDSQTDTLSIPPPPPPALPNMGGSFPPPPPPPPPIGPAPPTNAGPPPPPPPGAPVLSQRRESSKPIINPKSPMKPLFWKRIQVHAVSSNKQNAGRNIFWEEVEEEPVNFQYLEDLFAKVPVESKKKVSTSQARPKAVQLAKVIQPKRSQAVGILLSSLRLEFSDIEDAILNLDTSILDIEKFKAIYDNRSDSEEMKMIKCHIQTHPEVPLDKPEQFLYDLEQIPFVTDRIFCFLFQSSFQESISTIDAKLNNVKMTCEALSSCESVKRIFGLILACGNYMNGGSRTRGQADGFDLEILPKLKDVKGKDNCTSLLQFVVSRYVHQYDTDVVGTDRAKLPLPDPSDIQQARLVNFEELEKELKRLQKDFNSAEDKAKNIIKCSASETLEPFKSVMTSCFEKGRQNLKEQEENISECSKIFDSTCSFFCVKPKTNEQSVTPEHFFSLWTSFCSDFKDIWKKEQQAVMKIRIREAEERVKTIKESKLALPPTRAKKIGGLKDKLSRQGKL